MRLLTAASEAFLVYDKLVNFVGSHLDFQIFVLLGYQKSGLRQLSIFHRKASNT